MNIPLSCRSWRAKMAAGTDEEKRVLENMETDPCVRPDVERDFFSRLASTGTPATSKEAWEQAKGVVFSDPDRFLCTGNEVPKALFRLLVRLCDGGKFLDRILPASEAKRLKAETGLSGDPGQINDRQMDALSASLRKYAEGGGRVVPGKWDHAVWVGDQDVARVPAGPNPLSRVPRQIVERMGLLPDRLTQGEQLAGRFVVLIYERSATGRTLHVPRVLDAVHQPEFRPEVDCGAPHGTARPLGSAAKSGASGLPEAVHRSCETQVKHLGLGYLS
jgi:hypothetical protein